MLLYLLILCTEIYKGRLIIIDKGKEKSGFSSENWRISGKHIMLLYSFSRKAFSFMFGHGHAAKYIIRSMDSYRWHDMHTSTRVFFRKMGHGHIKIIYLHFDIVTLFLYLLFFNIIILFKFFFYFWFFLVVSLKSDGQLLQITYIQNSCRGGDICIWL